MPFEKRGKPLEAWKMKGQPPHVAAAINPYTDGSKLEHKVRVDASSPEIRIYNGFQLPVVSAVGINQK